MTTPQALAATWDDGVFLCIGGHRHRELTGLPVGALAPDGRGGALAMGALETSSRCAASRQESRPETALLGHDVLVAASTDHFAKQLSTDSGQTWGRLTEGLPAPSSVLLL